MVGEVRDRGLKDDLTYFIIVNIILAALFFIGLYLQIRIIIVSKLEKEKTWKIDICHSAIMTVGYSFRISFEMITYFVPSLHLYTGKWFCYVSLYIKLFFMASVVSHSLLVSIYKYVIIVHQGFIRGFGEERASKFLFWIYLSFPPLWALLSGLARGILPDISSIYECLGEQVYISDVMNETSKERFRRYFFCGFDDVAANDLDNFAYVMNVTKMIGCFLTVVILFMVMANVLEVFFYLRIFAYMKR